MQDRQISLLSIPILTLTIGTLVSETASCQTVLLPTQNRFSIGTTVSVPDRGGLYLGGVNRSQTGRIERGILGTPFRNRAIGSSLNNSGASVHTTITSLRETDKAVLAEAANRHGGRSPVSEVEQLASFLSRHVARWDSAPAQSSAERSAVSVAAILAAKRGEQSQPLLSIASRPGHVVSRSSGHRER